MGLSGIILFASVVAFAAASDYYPGCPTLFSFFPNVNDCSRFYRCFWGKPVAFQCPENTRWSQAKLTCDHYENVACGYRSDRYPYQPHAYAAQSYYPYRAAYAPEDYPTYYKNMDNFGHVYPAGTPYANYYKK